MTGILAAMAAGTAPGAGSDFHLDAIVWNAISGSTFAPTNVVTLSGITGTVTIQMDRTGTQQVSYYKNGVWTDIATGASLTAINGDMLAFAVNHSGAGTKTGNITLTNLSDASTIISNNSGVGTTIPYSISA